MSYGFFGSSGFKLTRVLARADQITAADPGVDELEDDVGIVRLGLEGERVVFRRPLEAALAQEDIAEGQLHFDRAGGRKQRTQNLLALVVPFELGEDFRVEDRDFLHLGGIGIALRLLAEGIECFLELPRLIVQQSEVIR